MSTTNATNTTNPCGNPNCPYESVIKELQKDSERNSEQHREFYNKFSDQGQAIAIAEERYNNLLTCVSEIKTSISAVQGSVEELKNKPAKRWESVVSCIISSIIGIIVGLLFNNLV